MRFTVLGPVELELGGRVVDLGTPKQRALVVRLLLEANRPVSVDRLVEDLWDGDPPGRATSSLQAYVSNLRRILEPHRAPRTAPQVLVTRPPGYLLRVPDDAVDAAVFQVAAARATTAHAAGRSGDAHAAASEALGLWRGPALLDVREEPFAAAAVAELDDLRLTVEEIRLAASVELGRAGEAAAELESLVAAEPLRERLWELLVLALYRSGRPAAALARYRKVRALLDAELGLEPGPRLRELEQAVLRHDASVLDPSPQVTVPRGTADGPPRLGAADFGEGGPAGGWDADRVPDGGSEVAGKPVAALDSAGRPPMVGREALMARLAAALEAASSGVPRWVVLTGEAGVGKSRLAEALRDRALALGFRCADARCHDDADTPPHWVWAQVLRDLVADADSGGGTGGATDPLAAVAGAARNHGDGDTARFALYEGIRRALDSAARSAPLLLVLEDLHWADGDSLRALRFLAVQLHDLPILVVATVRDGEVATGLEELLATVDRRPGAERVAVPPIDADAVRAIAESLTGGPVDALTGRDLHARSGGNPFFATELARLTTTTAGGTHELPAGVREVVRRRLARLPDDVRAVLATAAVIGLVVDVTVLAAAEGLELSGLLERLDPALATGVLVDDAAPLRVRFAHALLRESLLAEQTPVQRQRRHGRLAAALRERRVAGASPDLAHHLVEAGPFGNLLHAQQAATEVGRQAVDRLAFDEAARWFGRALEVAAQREALDGPDDRVRLRLLLARGDSLFRSGQVALGRQELLAATEVALDLDDLDAVAEAAAALGATGGVWSWVDLVAAPPAVIRRLETTLDRLGDGDSPARVRLLLTIATGLYYGGDQGRVASASSEAVAMARRLGEPRLLADALLDRAFVLRLPDSSAEAVALTDEALAQPGLSDIQVVVGHGRRFSGLLHAGDLPAAVAAHRQALDAARRAGLWVPQMQLGHFPAGLAVAEGRFADAEALIAEAWARDERGDLYGLAEGLVGLQTMLAWHQGELARWAPALEENARRMPVRGAHQLLALAYAAAGDLDAADAAWRVSRAAPSVPWLEVVADAAEVEVLDALGGRPGREPDAEERALLAVLTPRVEMIAAVGTTFPWGPVALALGMLEHRLGLLEEAEGHLRRCLARSDAWGTRTWSALTRWRLAAVLEDRGDPGEAGQLRAAAITAAADIGLTLPRTRSVA